MSVSGDDLTFYHNPRCSKSRSALALLQERGVVPRIVEYLQQPPSRETLADLVRLLEIKPEGLVRKGEAIYREQYKDKSLNDEQWIDALAQNPILIERPIAVRGNRAVIGRPPEAVLDLLD
ncbi:MAG: arsenate reductase (glutaredoxin) [Betaproteobacteria bacterium]